LFPSWHRGQYKAAEQIMSGGLVAQSTAKPAKGAKPIYVLNGPNLNLLGQREPEIYGRTSLADIARLTAERAEAHGYSLTCRQTNSEAELIGWVHEARTGAAGVILNAGGLSHTSVSLLDACRALDIPLIEVHLSNPHAREPYRRHSYVSEAAAGVIVGLGANGYLLAIDAVAAILEAHTQ
jgi:3-dehydroquinate dehydratase-2